MRVAKAVQKNFNEKYGPEGGFDDPANTDPFEEKEPDWADSSIVI